MKRIFFFLLFPISAFSQNTDTLTLDFCQQKAIENYPLIKQKDLINKTSELKLFNITKTYLPQLSLNGQATYQSDVTEIPIHIPGMEIPSLYKDMYKATFDVTQVVYDGGFTVRQKKLEAISLQSNLQSLETELYKIKDNVNTIYFSIVALQENKKLLLLLKKDIKNKLTKVESGVKNGILLESNADVLKAEIIKIEEQIIELESGIESGLKMLGDYMSQVISDGVAFKLPETTVVATDYENARPEIKVFELQQQKLNVSKSLLDCKLMPKVAGFGQLGYGRPGLNMLSNSFDSYYMVGAKITWALWDWNQSKNEKRLLDLQSQVLNTQKESFIQGIKILLEKNIADIQKYQDLLVKDKEIIALREKIIKSAASQLENGTITATEYLTELNAASQAKVNMESHKIQLVKASVDYLTTKGKY
ncbi:MAG: TolC family protein [Bacteroidales bacterium]